MEIFFGANVYTIENKNICCRITEECAMNVIDFKLNGKVFSPFFIPPWWNEKQENTTALRKNLRGTFFCLPMGNDAEGIFGKDVPVHGFGAHNKWKCKYVLDNSILLSFEKGNIEINKSIEIDENNCVVYENNAVSGVSGKFPVAYHPSVKLPENKGESHIYVSNVKKVFTTPKFTENSANGGYCLFKSAKEYDDYKDIETIFDDSEDLSCMPIRDGFDDIVIMAQDVDAEIGCSAVTYKKEGMIYFQLKNPKAFPETMFWISNGGRYYEPWNGRCKRVLGIEDCASYFLYGVKQSAEENILSTKGFETCHLFKNDGNDNFKIIYGATVAPKSFKGVKNVTKTKNGIQILGLDNQKINVDLKIDFLR